jgi:hypothetical protein
VIVLQRRSASRYSAQCFHEPNYLHERGQLKYTASRQEVSQCNSVAKLTTTVWSPTPWLQLNPLPARQLLACRSKSYSSRCRCNTDQWSIAKRARPHYQQTCRIASRPAHPRSSRPVPISAADSKHRGTRAEKQAGRLLFRARASGSRSLTRAASAAECARASDG